MSLDTPRLASGFRVAVGPVRTRVLVRPLAVGGFAIVVLAIVGVVTLMHGTLRIPAGEVVDAVFGNGEDRVVRTVRGRRLPRFLTGVLVGGGLGAAGAVFQSVSRNALGSPDIIGLTAGASAAAVTQVVVFDGDRVAVALSALVGGVGTALAVYLLARRDGTSGGERFVLVGIGIGAMCTAVINLMVVRAEIETAVNAQTWLAGSLLARDWTHVQMLAAASVVLLPVLVVLGRRLTMMEMGDDLAAGLGVNVERVRFATIVLGVLLTGAAVAATGPIAFVALAAPQIAGKLSNRSGVRLVNSWIIGAVLLAAADLASEAVDLGLRMPVGTLTALLGGVYLMWLLGRKA